jgi:hypothetical protein
MLARRAGLDPNELYRVLLAIDWGERDATIKWR